VRKVFQARPHFNECISFARKSKDPAHAVSFFAIVIRNSIAFITPADKTDQASGRTMNSTFLRKGVCGNMCQCCEKERDHGEESRHKKGCQEAADQDFERKKGSEEGKKGFQGLRLAFLSPLFSFSA
jgi:hypothetical protein